MILCITGQTAMQLFGAPKNRLIFGEKSSSREKENIVVAVYFCVISVMFLPVRGSYTCDYAHELPVLCSNLLSELLQCRYCATVGDLLDHRDNSSPTQLCHMSLS